MVKRMGRGLILVGFLEILVAAALLVAQGFDQLVGLVVVVGLEGGLQVGQDLDEHLHLFFEIGYEVGLFTGRLLGFPSGLMIEA